MNWVLLQVNQRMCYLLMEFLLQPNNLTVPQEAAVQQRMKIVGINSCKQETGAKVRYISRSITTYTCPNFDFVRYKYGVVCCTSNLCEAEKTQQSYLVRSIKWHVKYVPLPHSISILCILCFLWSNNEETIIIIHFVCSYYVLIVRPPCSNHTATSTPWSRTHCFTFVFSHQNKGR